jgi:hypothetical protein
MVLCGIGLLIKIMTEAGRVRPSEFDHPPACQINSN